jgi:hypothetical protein
MSDVLRDPPMKNLKLSELCLYIPKDKRLIRITGNIDATQLNNVNSLVLSSREYNESTQSFKQYKCLIDVECLYDFDLKDFHAQHDLVQFIGYKQEIDCLSSANLEFIQFKAIYFRIIKRQTIEKYYFALDVQNNYLNRNYK